MRKNKVIGRERRRKKKRKRAINMLIVSVALEA